MTWSHHDVSHHLDVEVSSLDRRTYDVVTYKCDWQLRRAWQLRKAWQHIKAWRCPNNAEAEACVPNDSLPPWIR